MVRLHVFPSSYQVVYAFVLMVCVHWNAIEARMSFVIPTLSKDQWTVYNNELKATLGPIHLDLSTNDLPHLKLGKRPSTTYKGFSLQRLSSSRRGEKEVTKKMDIYNTTVKLLKKLKESKTNLGKRRFGKIQLKTIDDPLDKQLNFTTTLNEWKRVKKRPKHQNIMRACISKTF